MCAKFDQNQFDTFGAVATSKSKVAKKIGKISIFRSDFCFLSMNLDFNMLTMTIFTAVHLSSSIQAIRCMSEILCRWRQWVAASSGAIDAAM